MPHSYMVSRCTASHLHQVCTKLNKNIDDAMMRILVRCLSRVNFKPQTIVIAKDPQNLSFLSFDTLQPDSAAESAYGKNLVSLHSHVGSQDMVVISGSPQDADNMLPTLPQSAVASVTYTPFKDSLEPVTNYDFDPMDESFAMPESDLKNQSWVASKSVKISLTFDATKLETDKAGALLKHMKSCVEDPDLIHL